MYFSSLIPRRHHRLTPILRRPTLRRQRPPQRWQRRRPRRSGERPRPPSRLRHRLITQPPVLRGRLLPTALNRTTLTMHPRPRRPLSTHRCIRSTVALKLAVNPSTTTRRSLSRSVGASLPLLYRGRRTIPQPRERRQRRRGNRGRGIRTGLPRRRRPRAHRHRLSTRLLPRRRVRTPRCIRRHRRRSRRPRRRTNSLSSLPIGGRPRPERIPLLLIK